MQDELQRVSDASVKKVGNPSTKLIDESFGPHKVGPGDVLAITLTTTGQDVSPRDYTGRISAWYFGSAT